MGVEVLDEVPDVDHTELQAAVRAVMAAVDERLCEPPTPAAGTQ
jgi:hypothetical protein